MPWLGRCLGTLTRLTKCWVGCALEDHWSDCLAASALPALGQTLDPVMHVSKVIQCVSLWCSVTQLSATHSRSARRSCSTQLKALPCQLLDAVSRHGVLFNLVLGVLLQVLVVCVLAVSHIWGFERVARRWSLEQGRVLRPVEAMMQCLAILLFKECNGFLNHWEVENWAATETVLWHTPNQQKAEELEIYLGHREMVDEGWFGD